MTAFTLSLALVVVHFLYPLPQWALFFQPPSLVPSVTFTSLLLNNSFINPHPEKKIDNGVLSCYLMRLLKLLENVLKILFCQSVFFGEDEGRRKRKFKKKRLSRQGFIEEEEEVLPRPSLWIVTINFYIFQIQALFPPNFDVDCRLWLTLAAIFYLLSTSMTSVHLRSRQYIYYIHTTAAITFYDSRNLLNYL